MLRYAVDCLRIIAWGNLAYAFGMVLIQAFNGAGDSVTPTIINVIGFWMCEVPLAWALAFPAHTEVRGVFTSIPIAEVFITLMGGNVSERWMENKDDLNAYHVRPTTCHVIVEVGVSDAAVSAGRAEPTGNINFDDLKTNLLLQPVTRTPGNDRKGDRHVR